MTNKQLSKLDERMAARNDIKTAVIYSMRNWLAYYMLPGNTHLHDNTQYLEKAYLGAMAAHRKNEPSANLFSLTIFMAIESRHLDTANDMLDAALGYRSFLKANEPFYFTAFSFLRAYLATVENRGRAAKKYRKSFLSHLKNAEYSPYYDVMTGQLHLAAEEYKEAYGFFTRAHGHGCRSMYLYEGLFRSLSAAEPDETGEELLPTLIYAARHGADISRETATHEDAVFAAIMKSPSDGERLYALSKHAPLLKPVCANRMHNRDYSLAAHSLYNQAVNQQVDLGGLIAFLVQSSYANHVQEISNYALERFISSTDMKPTLAAYVFHLILTDPAHASLINKREDVALQYAAKCLESGLTGREANSLYQFFWAHLRFASVSNELKAKAESELQAGLTQFELTTTHDTRYIYIAHPEKRGTEEYELAENNRLIIDATSDGFSYTCLGAGRRVVITEPLVIRRMAPLANPELYRHFFDKGDRRFHVLAYLATYYMEAESPHTGAILVYEAILEEKSLQKPYRMKILAALGHLYHIAGNHTKALDCYTQIDMTALPEAYLQQALEICLQTHEYALATEIISQNHVTLPAQAVYEGLHQLFEDTPAEITGTRKHLAEAAFNLLLSGHYSETLMETVLTYYQASQSELKTLSRSLKTPDPRLDTKILSGGLWAHQCDAHIQKAFLRLMTANKAQDVWASSSRSERPAQKECEQFIEYCTYAMLTQNFSPDYEIINILEKIYMASTQDTKHEAPQELNCAVNSNNLLLLALCHLYLHHNITTFRSDKLLKEAISVQEAIGVLLPVFKENKPASHPYLEKYQPFLYQSQPGKDIRLNYRLDETKKFQSIHMRYLAYGLYTAILPLFYNETITYFYSDEMATGSIATHLFSHKNSTPYIHSHPNDDFFAINNAIIHEQMFRHQEVEDILARLVNEPVSIRGQLI